MDCTNEERRFPPLRPKSPDSSGQARESFSRSGPSRPIRRKATMACCYCRQKRAKCDGQTPSCSACVQHGKVCKYEIDRRRKGSSEAIIDRLERKNRQLESIVDKWVPHYHEDRGLLSDTISQSTPKSTLNLSFGSTDYTTEDNDRNAISRATGFLGKNTDASAIRSLNLAAQQSDTSPTCSSGPNINGNTTSLPGVQNILRETESTSMGSSLNDLPITTPTQIEPQEKPPFHLGKFLVGQYFPTVQRYFPVIDELDFLRNFWSTYNVASDPVPLEAKWPIMMNLVFAISAKYCEVTQVHFNLGRHLEYFKRARMHGLSENSLFDYPDLQQVQIEGLLALYFLISGQTNRAWKISGISVRSALSLGLNIRSTGQTITDVSREFRIRIWWSIWTLDQALSLITGRNSEVDLALCNVPLPRPFVEGGFDDSYHHLNVGMLDNDLEAVLVKKRISSYTISSFALCNDSKQTLSSELRRHKDKFDASPTDPKVPLTNDSHLYFHYIQLSLISQDVTKELYMLDSPRRPWPDIEDSLSTLWGLTTRWLHQLPHAYRFDRSGVSIGSEALSLGCFFYSVRIMISRPCLCRYDARKAESSRIALFHQNMAKACIESAKAIIALFPDEFDVHGLCEGSTWWQFSHYLVQAIIVLLIEIKFWEKPPAKSSDKLIRIVKKALHSIWLLSKADASAFRAWSLCRNVFRRIVVEEDLHVRDVVPGGSHSNLSGSFPDESRMPSDFATEADSIAPAGSFYSPFDEVHVFGTLLYANTCH